MRNYWKALSDKTANGPFTELLAFCATGPKLGIVCLCACVPVFLPLGEGKDAKVIVGS